MMKEYHRILNDEQKRAVKHFKGPCMVLAGPGTGKTTIIVNRTMNLIKNCHVEPENILVVTFTKVAADEMKERFTNIKGYLNKYKKVTFGTFHSIFFKVLQHYKSYRIENLINEKERYIIIKTIVRDLGFDFFEDEQMLDDLINELSYTKNMLIPYRKYIPTSFDYNQFWLIYEQYERYKNERKRFDFEDMINHCYELLIDSKAVLNDLRLKYKYILIDEFQDINKSQFNTIALIAYPLNNLFVVGDDDQSIYRFRGSDPNAMHEFSNLFANVNIIILKNNYRNSKSILDSAMFVINNNCNRYKKDLITVKDFGKAPYIVRVEDNEREAESIVKKIKNLINKGINYSDMAVLYRTKIQSRSIIDTFVNNRIPFICCDGISSIHNHWIYIDIISYLKASQNIERNNSIYRIINKPYRYIGRNMIFDIINSKKDILDSLIQHKGISKYQKRNLRGLKNSLNNISIMKTGQAVSYIRKHIGYENYIKEYADTKNINIKPLIEVLDEVSSSVKKFDSILEYLNHIKLITGNNFSNITEKNSVKIMTMHKAKGLEFNIVFIIGAIDGLTPNILNDELDIQLLEEERRIFYVAMTRAKDQLYFFVPKYRYGKKMKQSRFLNEILNC